MVGFTSTRPFGEVCREVGSINGLAWKHEDYESRVSGGRKENIKAAAWQEAQTAARPCVSKTKPRDRATLIISKEDSHQLDTLTLATDARMEIKLGTPVIFGITWTSTRAAYPMASKR